MRVEIVTNSTREAMKLPNGVEYVYIPMTHDEKKLMGVEDMYNACWRLMKTMADGYTKEDK